MLSIVGEKQHVEFEGVKVRNDDGIGAVEDGGTEKNLIMEVKKG